ncbi:MAG TPA: 7,8-didemethyl-8-hydroxy-5-deazariboflavin synthase subunit CofG [Candidatus Obscuribacterales bacterium]
MSLSRVVTYSPAYTVVPTYECFNRCTYCNFRTDPGKSPWLTLSDAERLLKPLQSQGICEILILSGEVHPHSSRRAAWFGRIYDLCELALSMGFLPHTNAGPLSYEEMAALKMVNVSMGLMLEQLTPDLLKTVHKHAPSKLPQLRLQQLEWAGELRIPFTTGLLLGIGEAPEDWWETLDAIAHLHQRWGHIQEVILQPHSPGSQQTCDAPAFDPHQLPEVIAKAREILPDDITIQIPPNLVKDASWLLACLDAGARDLGGIGPKDEVNPDYPHPPYERLREILEPAGWELVARSPVYPQYDSWLSVQLLAAVKRWRNCMLSV